jgi:hypothetical protein
MTSSARFGEEALVGEVLQHGDDVGAIASRASCVFDGVAGSDRMSATLRVPGRRTSTDRNLVVVPANPPAR